MVSNAEPTSEALTPGWLAAIVQSSHEAIVSETLNGIITSWNPSAERLFGYSAEEIVGRSIVILAGPGRETEAPAMLERIRRGETVQDFETVRRCTDGRLIDVSLTVSPVRDQKGLIVGVSKIIRDITEHKRAERARREAEKRFRDLANAIPDIIWTAVPEGTIDFVNDQWFRFCGFAPEPGSRRWPRPVLHVEDRRRCLEQWHRSLRVGTNYEIEIRLRRYDGEYRWFLIRAVPVRDAGGQITAWFGSATDIQDRKQSEERLQVLTAELSHRVKNLLSVVQVLAERSCSNATSAEECLKAFRGRLQALSAAHTELVAGDWKTASLSSLIQTALKPYSGDGDRIRLTLQDLRLDPERALTLGLGLHELATNAAKYGALSSPTGRICVTADIHFGNNGKELHIVWQENDGPAVEPPLTEGFGITMLSQAIQYQHEGRVDLDWRDEGLVCRIILPL
jgi:PAS domain S-box-containing protein